MNLDNPEPNDAQGSEECVRMRNGVMNDARCGNTQGGKKVKLIYLKNITNQVKKIFKGNGMGYICERHHPCENKRSGTSFTGYRGGDYIIQAPGYFSANDAKGQSLKISRFFENILVKFFLKAIKNSLIKTPIRTLNRSSDHRKSRNLNYIVDIFELENKNQSVHGIRTHDLTRNSLKSYPLDHKSL